MADIKVLTILNGLVQPRADIQIPMDAFGQFVDEPAFVSGVDKVNQDVAKGLLTQLGSDIMATNYGTNLSLLTRARKLDDVAEQITEEIQSLLGYLANYNLNEPADEQIVELVDLRAEEGIDTVKVTMVVRTGSGQTATVSLT